MGFSDWVRVEAVGFSGGIWTFWNKSSHVSVIATHPQFILLQVKSDQQNPWFYAVVYGSPTHHLRRRLWAELTITKHNLYGPLLIAGDFNSVITREDIDNYTTFSSQRSSDFAEWIQSEGLVDMGYNGPKFTWVKSFSSGVTKSARLDRAFCNVEWRQRFPEAVVSHLPRVASDHAPILIQVAARTPTVRPFPFRFQAAWFTNNGLYDIVNTTWDTSIDFCTNVARMGFTLAGWNKSVFGNIHHKKKAVLARLSGVQRRLTSSPHVVLFKLERKLMEEYKDILYQEELLWFQRSWEEWIASGDRNTAYYHVATTIRRARNTVTTLRGDDGCWITDSAALKSYVRAFYEDLFSSESRSLPHAALGGAFPCPRPRWLPCSLLSKIVGDSLYQLVQQAFTNGTFPREINDTLLVLIPKIQSPETIKQFRLISLCNVSYKLITKTITNKLKCILPTLVGPFQSSFVPGRQISDNVIIFQEVMHSMRTKRGQCGHMAIKLDFEKTYDRLSWSFIESTLQEADFDQNWITLIMYCIRTPSMSINWNGERLQHFRPERGIRQGDAMSPAIFVLCLEKLSQMISLKVDFGEWKGLRLVPSCPTLSHLCFANDTVLFTEASLEQVDIVKDCLLQFCDASGQRINFAKSQVFFSKNVPPVLASAISNQLQIEQTNDLGKYLGVKSIHGRVTCHHFTELLDRINGRLEGWKTKTLSVAGRVTLAKAVLNAIPTYTMQTSVLPARVCLEIEKRTRRFIWGHTSPDSQSKMNLVRWEVVTTPIHAGGLGLYRLQTLNQAYMAKLRYRLHTEHDRFWARTILSKYANPRWSQSSKNISNVWRGIMSAQHITERGLVQQVRNGKSTKFWMDKWFKPFPLHSHLTTSLSLPELYATVNDYWEEGRGWKWERLTGLIPDDILESLAGFVLSGDDTVDDEVGWGLDKSGFFSLSSAYEVATHSTPQSGMTIWTKIWGLQVPHRIWHHEDCNHLFRQCKEIRGIWEADLGTQAVRGLQHLDWADWLKVQINGDRYMGIPITWPERFAIRLWWIWKWRSAKVFKQKSFLLSHKLAWLKRQEEVINSSFSRRAARVTPNSICVARSDSWTTPTGGWFKLNVDGSVINATGAAGCGCVLRDDTGRWVEGFTYHIGRCSVAEAEAWGVLQGLRMAAHKGISNLIVESDSKVTINQLRGTHQSLGQHNNIIGRCISVAQTFGAIRFTHVLRDQNCLADAMAKKALSTNSGVVTWSETPNELASLVLHDRLTGGVH
ncbi:uncharacterized protein LOC116027569 [Ipomoea triloba]|uniref:uncharacterized protein LOC116027569 n=1 Tax=Ipomoea triloba TaxID=35885 RepID=UPI00125CEE17|nr:uncharacterized protein LOC116027569 [Ipomoea triloba]